MRTRVEPRRHSHTLDSDTRLSVDLVGRCFHKFRASPCSRWALKFTLRIMRSARSFAVLTLQLFVAVQSQFFFRSWPSIVTGRHDAWPRRLPYISAENYQSIARTNFFCGGVGVVNARQSAEPSSTALSCALSHESERFCCS